MKTLKLKINSVPGYSGTISVQTDKNGVPLERFWRQRLQDAKSDNCVDIMQEKRIISKKGRAK
jgi:hypothetical protein